MNDGTNLTQCIDQDPSFQICVLCKSIQKLACKSSGAPDPVLGERRVAELVGRGEACLPSSFFFLRSPPFGEQLLQKRHLSQKTCLFFSWELFHPSQLN